MQFQQHASETALRRGTLRAHVTADAFPCLSRAGAGPQNEIDPLEAHMPVCDEIVADTLEAGGDPSFIIIVSSLDLEG